MLSDVRNYYGLARDFAPTGYFETEHSEQIVRELKLEIKTGKLLALSGIVGCGKTTMLRRIQEALSQDKDILASKSLSLEKSQISLATLIMALFYDLATEKDFKIPTQPERRERALRDLIKKRQKPIALFIDDAHDLHSKTLIGLKRLIGVPLSLEPRRTLSAVGPEECVRSPALERRLSAGSEMSPIAAPQMVTGRLR